MGEPRGAGCERERSYGYVTYRQPQSLPLPRIFLRRRNGSLLSANAGVNIGLNALGATFHCVNEGADAMGYLTGIGASVAAGLIVNGFSILIDGRLGKLSTTLLEVRALNQVLFGIGNYAIKGLAIVGRSVWRTVGDKVTDFGKYLFGRLLR